MLIVLQQGIPNLEAAAVVVLRHWNDGKIPFYTAAPKTATTTVNSGSAATGAASSASGMQVDDAANSGDAILTSFTTAVDLDGLLSKFGGSGEYDEEEDAGLVKAKEATNAAASMPIDEE
jgi:nuclear GTP-binding protein